MRSLRFIFLASYLGSVISCLDVYSARAVPSEKDSVVDQRLIGAWEPVEEDSEKDTDDENKPMLLIGRSRISKNTMKYLMTNIPQILPEEKRTKNNEEETLQYFHGVLYLHRGKINIVCFRSPHLDDEPKKKENIFLIYRYKIRDSNTLLLYDFDLGYLKKAVEKNMVKGRIEKPKNKKQTPTVILDDNPKNIIAYLEAHPEAFEKKPMAYGRINHDVVKKKDVEAEISEPVVPKTTSVGNVTPPKKIEVSVPTPRPQ